MFADLIIMILMTVSPVGPEWVVIDITTKLTATECVARAAAFGEQAEEINDVGQLIAVCEPYFEKPSVKM